MSAWLVTGTRDTGGPAQCVSVWVSAATPFPGTQNNSCTARHSHAPVSLILILEGAEKGCHPQSANEAAESWRGGMVHISFLEPAGSKPGGQQPPEADAYGVVTGVSGVGSTAPLKDSILGG